MQPYGWAAVPNRVWDESCICVLSANGDAEGLFDDPRSFGTTMWDGTTVDGHNDIRCTPTAAVMNTDLSRMGLLNLALHSPTVVMVLGDWSFFWSLLTASLG